MSDRQKEILIFHKFQLPAQAPMDKRLCDIKFSLQWSKANPGKASCMSSGSAIWIGHRARLCLGIEMFRFFNIEIDERVLGQFEENFLSDLAGNAFDSSCFLVAWIALQSAVALCHQQQPSEPPKALQVKSRLETPLQPTRGWSACWGLSRSSSQLAPPNPVNLKRGWSAIWDD